MAKRIAFCSDGTWETASSYSNVYRLYKSLLITGDQMPFYDDGVGAVSNIFLKVVEGASGVGLRQKVKDGYTKIAHVYEAGDQIFIFGFSRGAFTARSLAGMIAACGLPTENFSTDLVNGASILGDGKVVLILNLLAVVEHVSRANPEAGVSSFGLLLNHADRARMALSAAGGQA